MSELTLLGLRASAAAAIEGYASVSGAADLEAMIASCERLGDRPEVLVALTAVWGYEFTRGDFAQSRSALDWMNRLVLSPALAWFDAEVHACDGFQLWFEGSIDDALKQLYAATESFSKRDPAALVSPFWLLPNDPLAAAHAGVMCLAGLQGRMAEAERECRTAYARAAEVPFPRGPFSEAFVSIYEAWLRLSMGDVDAARRCGARAVEIADAFGFYYLRAVASPYLCLARPDEASDPDALLAAAAVMSDAIGQLAFLPAHYANLAEAYERRGELDRALKAVDEGINIVDRTGERLHLSNLLRLRGRYAITRGASAAGLADLREAAALADRQGHRVACLKAGLELASIAEEFRPDDWRVRLRSALNAMPSDCRYPDVVAARAHLAV
jgi:tetratricopeptide (TPR) repeat protein